MRWLVDQLLAVSLGLASASAGDSTRLNFECRGADFNVHRGKGRLSGPVRVQIGDWIIECSREALVTARSTLVRNQTTGAIGVEGVNRRIIFLGQCRASHGLTCLEAPALVLDLEKLTVTGSGLGMTLTGMTDEPSHSTHSDARATIDLESGQMSRTDLSWSPAHPSSH
ncbi:hypothetical protein ACFQY0_01400 [Haloferula chungangensis]|uniref:Uncharacterized protein n=1 Tax=Haloferula chungangensis TaxID=1048331 RepID=A0ABW2L2R0_9BACT